MQNKQVKSIDYYANLELLSYRIIKTEDKVHNILKFLYQIFFFKLDKIS